MEVPTVVYDANVLYPAPLRDFLVRLGVSGLVRSRWTDAIHDEWIRSLLRNRPDLTPDHLRRTRALMDRAVRDCLIMSYEDRIDDLSQPDPDDRHVLAAAIHANAEIILTFNTRDYPKATLASYSIVAQRPDDFVAKLFDRDAGAICAVARAQRSALISPVQSVKQFLTTLRGVGLTKTAAHLETRPNDATEGQNQPERGAGESEQAGLGEQNATQTRTIRVVRFQSHVTFERR
ncbi:MAG: PIN domain-containing protein [Longimicrobiales bacterium]